MISLGADSRMKSENGFDVLPPVNRVNRWVGDFFNNSSNLNHYSNFPNINILSDKDGILIEAEMPGMEIEDIHLDIKDQILSISGERKNNFNKEDERWTNIYNEIYSGKFSRELKLPFKVDLKNIKATLHNGILRLNMLKSELEKPIRISISPE